MNINSIGEGFNVLNAVEKKGLVLCNDSLCQKVDLPLLFF